MILKNIIGKAKCDYNVNIMKAKRTFAKNRESSNNVQKTAILFT
ncbi:hypothetical protein GMES_3208 [Paraglaciecola mesophila KMM 241]|uniref:Uncharacterized protein n=1 Tax=Paraglaciecola mesophila KMM 241 TaxID=1128912 RepID=K6YNC2_9ALTE|nr:hypothetical protein GMES_3208 [Paraglaciecola mesophila KMM 241]